MATLLEFNASSAVASAGSLTNVIGDPWTVARASTGSRFDSSGVWFVEPDNVPRITHDPISGANPRMLIEPESTNKFRFSYGVSSGSWVKADLTFTQDSLTTPDGGTNGDELVMGVTGSLSQTVTTTINSGPYVTSFWVKSFSGGTSFRIGTSGTATGEFTDITITTEWAQYFWASSASGTTEYPQISNQNGASATIGIWLPGFIEGSEVLSEIVTDGTLNADNGYGEIRLEDVIQNTVPAGGATMTTWINGVSDGGQPVTPGATITMVDGTTALIIEDAASATRTVEIEWVDSISVAATGNKIYRDDVEIADIANGIQIYQDPNAPAGVESKYEVQAHDGAGDETTDEVEGENMDYITPTGV